VLIDDSDLSFVCTHVNNLNSCGLAHDWHWESVVNKDSCDKAIRKAHDQRFRLGWPTDNLYELDMILEDPLTDEYASESKKLNLLFKDKDEVVGGHVEISAVNALVDLLVGFVLHVKGVIGLDAVDNDFFWELHCETVLVYCDFLNVVTASNFDTRFSHKVLDNNIGHEFTVRVSFLVQAVHTGEVYSVRDDVTVVGASKDCVGCLVYADTPNPVPNLSDLAKFDALLIPECNLLITTRHYEILSGGVERNRTGVKAELFVGTHGFYSFTTLDSVKR
jgi:hypothetical protein